VSKDMSVNHIDFEDDPNGCPHCGEPRRERQCYQCYRIGLIVDCGHMSQPRPMQSKLNDLRDAQAKPNRSPTAFARLDGTSNNKLGSGVSNVQRSAEPTVTEPIIIVGIPPTKAAMPALPKADPKAKAEMRWLCKEPRELALGSGAVKECEWSY